MRWLLGLRGVVAVCSTPAPCAGNTRTLLGSLRGFRTQTALSFRMLAVLEDDSQVAGRIKHFCALTSFVTIFHFFSSSLHEYASVSGTMMKLHVCEVIDAQPWIASSYHLVLNDSIFMLLSCLRLLQSTRSAILASRRTLIRARPP